METLDFVRPLDTKALFGAAFTLYRQNFWKLLAINFVFVLISLADGIFNLPEAIGQLPSALLSWAAAIVQMIVIAATTAAVSNAVLGRPVKVVGSFRRGLAIGYLLELLVLSIPAFLLAGLNGPFIRSIQTLFQQFQSGATSAAQVFLDVLVITSAVFVLRIFLEIALVFGPPVIVLEKRGVFGTVKRVFELFGSNAGRVLLNYGLLWLLPLAVLHFILYFPIALVIALIGLSQVGLSVDNIYRVGMTVGVPTSMIVNGLIQLLLNPVTSLLYTLLYYDTRARKENYSQELLAEGMGYEAMSEMMTV